jgi:cell division protein FtsB
VQSRPGKPRYPPRSGGANITSAVGMQETAGRIRARRTSLLTKTVMWVTALICIAFLLASLAQAWSNSQLMQQVQMEQQRLEQLQADHAHLVQSMKYYKDPSVIESEARQQLGYIRPGEHAVVIVGAANQGSQGAVHHTSAPAQSNFWQAWWNTFFGH